jgi:hypothetical protein
MTQNSASRQTTTVPLIGLLLACIAGCSFDAKIAYRPMPARPERPAAVIKLVVEDQREPSRGGNNKADVGVIRGGYGNPFGVHESGPERVAQLVKEATTDALQQAGVAAQAEGSRTLVATVKGFWVDGYAGVKAVVEVDCVLKDAQGNTLWSAFVKGASGGMVWIVGGSIAEQTLGKALADYAARAAEEFKSAPFQRAVF